MQASNDSISWPPEFSELKRLDVILKCGICYEFMKNCMITSCSHTYCSLCIRKFMQYKNQCPTCYEETFEIYLRNNRLLDEVIIIYTKIRDQLLRASRLASVNLPAKYEPKEKKSESQVVICNEVETKESKSNSNIGNDHAKVKEVVKLSVPDDSVIVNGIKVPGMFTSPKSTSTRSWKPEELAVCPVCQVKVPARNINMHLDSCLALDPAARPKPKVRKRSPLPKRVYTMMPEKNLKKFLKDYGLSTCGDRKALIGRLQRYTVIYNAENDSANPRPISELIKQLEREEKEEKKPNSNMRNVHSTAPRPILSKNDVTAIEKANKAYCEENKASFQKLIDEMRARDGRNIKPLKPTNRIYSDDEDDPNKVVAFTDQPTTSTYSSEFETDRGENTIMKAHSENSDSDGDIISDSETEEKSVNGKIDWNKTCINSYGSSTIYGELTQKLEPKSDRDLISDDDREEKIKISSPECKKNSDGSVSPEYIDSDDSMLETSIVATTPLTTTVEVPITNSRKVRRRLSLSCKKKEKKTKNKGNNVLLKEESLPDDITDECVKNNGNKDDDNELFDGEEDEEHIDRNNESVDKVKIDRYNDSNEFAGFVGIHISETNVGHVNGEDNIYNEEDRDIDDVDINEKIDTVSKETIEEKTAICEESKTPSTRLTRSAKRKTMATPETKNTELLSCPLSTNKKSKRDQSP